MKLSKIIIAALVVASSSFAVAPVVMAQSPGIVISGSSNKTKLPEKASKFLEKHYKGVATTKCKQLFARGIVKVDLANGTDIEFDLKGNVVEIDAPDGRVLPVAVVKDVLPSKSVKHLEQSGYINLVESIERKPNGKYGVELMSSNPDEIVYDIEGVFIGYDD